MIVYHADAKSTLKSSVFVWELMGQRSPGALSYRVLSGNIGVISEFENRQSRQFLHKNQAVPLAFLDDGLSFLLRPNLLRICGRGSSP